jgi:hypothetical protein
LVHEYGNILPRLIKKRILCSIQSRTVFILMAGRYVRESVWFEKVSDLKSKKVSDWVRRALFLNFALRVFGRNGGRWKVILDF